jgi:DNA-binding NarL/FixJ family response regulator
VTGGGYLARSTIRVLVVDDYEPWRRFVRSTLQKQPGLQIIGEVADGLEAVQKAEELQPDLILLDVRLPKLNGIEAARRIRELAPQSTILFVSLQASVDVMRAALGTGAKGYVFKTDARNELLTAVNAVLRGDQFVGSRFASHDVKGASDRPGAQRAQPNRFRAPLLLHNLEISHRHGVDFYADDAGFLDNLMQFSGAALQAGRAVIVVATESHRESLLLRLQAYGLEVAAGIEQGRYTAVDAAGTLSTFMVNGQPDRARFFTVVGDLIETSARAARAERPRVAACGECAALLLAQGKVEAAIRLEQFWNEVAKTYEVDILCGYPLASFHNMVRGQSFPRICAEHSAIRFQ